MADLYIKNPNPDNISAFLNLGEKTQNAIDNLKKVKLINDYDFVHNNPDNISQELADNNVGVYSLVNNKWYDVLVNWFTNQGIEFYIVIGGALLLLAIFDDK